MQQAATKAQTERDQLVEQLADLRKRTAEEIHRTHEKGQQRETDASHARKEARTAGELEAAKAQVVDLRAIIKDLSSAAKRSPKS